MLKWRPGDGRRPTPCPETAARTSGPPESAQSRQKTRRTSDNGCGLAYSTAQSVHVLDKEFRAAPFWRAARWSFVMNHIQELEKAQLEKLAAGKTIPDIGPGDTVTVNVKVKEGDRTRVQAYEGVCIGRNGGGINESFTVRKISYGEGVERVFPIYSPMIDSIMLVRRGKVRRAKLYYLRGLRGKSARIVEKQDQRQTTAAAAEKSFFFREFKKAPDHRGYYIACP